MTDEDTDLFDDSAADDNAASDDASATNDDGAAADDTATDDSAVVPPSVVAVNYFGSAGKCPWPDGKRFMVRKSGGSQDFYETQDEALARVGELL